MADIVRGFVARFGGEKDSGPATPGQKGEATGAQAIGRVEALAGSTVAPDLAGAVGASLGGQRAAVVLESTAPTSLLAQAVRDRLPLVAYDVGPVRPIGPGWVQIVARDAQSAADLALAARAIAEAALVPVCVSIERPVWERSGTVMLADRALVDSQLGQADDVVDCGTPEQELVYGNQRPRVPRRWDPDRPMLAGAPMSPAVEALAQAGERPFVAEAVPGVVRDVLARLATATGRPLAALQRSEGAASVVACGAAATNPGVIAITCLQPLDTAALAQALGGSPVATIDTDDVPLAGQPPLLRAAIAAGVRPGDILSVTSPRVPVPQDIELVRQALASGRRGHVTLGADLSWGATSFPKRQVLHDDLRRRFPKASEGGIARPKDAKAPAAERTAPAFLKRLRGTDLADLPRFFDQTGVLFRNYATHELSPDPYLTSRTLPPISSALRDLSNTRDSIPTFAPANCTGCGKCWTVCPEAAVTPTALSAKALIESGVASASGAAALRPVISRLADRVTSELKKADTPPDTAGPVLKESMGWLLEKMAPAEDRRKSLQDAFDAMVEQVALLPIAATDIFLGGGELLTLAINPDACKACGSCAEACEVDALTVTPQSDDVLADARRIWLAWEKLPDTEAATIDRVESDIGPLAASMLSRFSLLAMAGGDDSEPGAGDRQVLRAVLAVAENTLQPRVIDRIESNARTSGELARAIQSTLSLGLPTSDLSRLAAGLQGMGPGNTLADLANKVQGEFGEGQVDSAHVRRLVEASQQLAQRRDLLTSGPTGLGRTRLGLVLSPRIAEWSGAYPANPFPFPTVTAPTDQAAGIALGLARARAEQAVREAALDRWAALLLSKPSEAAHATRTLASLTWAELSAEERQAATPVLIVLSGQDVFNLVPVMASELPIKVVVLSEPAADDPDEVALLGLGRGGVVAQCSMGDEEQLFKAAKAAFTSPGPAVLRVHAPRPTAHGFTMNRSRQQAELALASGAWPIFCYDPAKGGIYGSNLELGPAPTGEPTDWTATEGRFEAWPKAELAAWAADRKEVRAALDELAGVTTPFTAGVKAAAEAAADKKLAAEVSRLQAEHAAELAALRAEIEADMHARVTRRLMAMAGHAPANGEG